MGLIEAAVMLAMVAINAVFAGYELALASVSVARLQVLVRDNRAGAHAALYMKQNMEASLAAVQVGITLVGAIAAATGGAAAEEVLQPLLQQQLGLSALAAEILAIAVIVVPLTGITIMCGELLPKVFALRNKEWVCLRLSPTMRWFTFSAWPAVRIFEGAVMAIMRWSERRWHVDQEPGRKHEAAELQELRAHAAQARASRLIGEREEGIIAGAVRLTSRSVREIMLPAEHISMLSVHSSLADSLVAAHLEMHTRFPVAEDPQDPQTILGYVNFKDIVALMRLSQPFEVSLRSIVRAIPSLRDDLLIGACLERLIHEHTHIALVRADDQQIVGMITMEDILEELVGDIQDEYDRLPVHAIRSGWAWIVGGGISLSRLKEVTNIDLTEDAAAKGVRTLSDWIAHQLNGAVHSGEILERGKLRLVVRKVRRQKVLEAQVSDTSLVSTETTLISKT